MRRGALILCGGGSTRMGRDKATLPFGRETMLQRVVRRLEPLVAECIVVARRDQALPVLPPGVRVAHDEQEGQGPLGGLTSGLAAASADALYVTGCDTPFLAAAFVELMFAQLGQARIAVADEGGFAHPLAAVYRRDVLPEVRALSDAGRLRPMDLHALVATTRVPEHLLRQADPDLRSLANINTPAAYAQALAHLEAMAPCVRIELPHDLRQLAGVAWVEVEARTLGEALVALGRRCPALEPHVVLGGALAPPWRASVGGRVLGADLSTPLAEGDTVLLARAQPW